MTEHKSNSTSNLTAVERFVPSIATAPKPPDACARASSANITATATPSVDRAHEVVCLCRGAVLRARSVRVDGGGKGVKVQLSPSYRIGFGRSLTG